VTSFITGGHPLNFLHCTVVLPRAGTTSINIFVEKLRRPNHMPPERVSLELLIVVKSKYHTFDKRRSLVAFTL